jgi:hypothetical protein
MKKILLTFCIFLAAASSQAQVKPAAMDFGFGFQVSGLSNVDILSFEDNAFQRPQALVRFYAMDQLAVRLLVGINTVSQTDEYSISYTDSVTRPEPFIVDSATTETFSQSVFSFAPGAEWHFKTTNKVDPYVGLEVPIAIKGASDEEFDQVYRFTDETGVPFFQQDVNVKTNTDGGFSIGVNLLAGFNYFFSEHIAIGAEYALGFLNTRDGGNIRTATTGTLIPSGNPDNVIVIDETQEFEQSSASSGIRTNTKGGINLSLFF